MHLPNDILALQQAPGLSENDAASIDHLPGLKSLKMRVRHWGTAPNVLFFPDDEFGDRNFLSFINAANKIRIVQ